MKKANTKGSLFMCRGYFPAASESILRDIYGKDFAFDLRKER